MSPRPMLGGILVLLAAASGPLPGAERPSQPVYVGARVCGSCHSGEAMGHQYSLWAVSKHARAYATLALPESKRIAKLSGIREEPQESAVCLGCHATAADAEAWEREPTFSIEDGVQCERCHGPGSDYIDEHVMRDREVSARAGLKFMTEQDCMVCHVEKGSHVAVLTSPTVDLEKGRRTIAHPTPENPTPAAAHAAPAQAGGAQPGPKYVGTMACARCHRGPGIGYQFSRWRMSRHADAYYVLATPAAYAIARKEGVRDEPQRSPRCLQCHTTGYDVPAGKFLESFSPDEGVGCEACHGPGSEYLSTAVMMDRPAAMAAGLVEPTRATCEPCHRDAHSRPFDFEAAAETIAHPNHPPEVSQTPRYKTPLNLALSPDGREIYVACEASDSVVVVDAAARRAVAEIGVGSHPADVTFSPDGTLAFVSNRFEDTVSVLDVAKREVIRTIPVGDGPHGVITDRRGDLLYVLNTSADSISLIDTRSFELVKQLSASRDPWSLALSPDGRRIAVTNALSRFVEFRTPSLSEVTVIDAERSVVDDRLEAPAANLLMGVDWHPGGEFALVTLTRTKNLVPMTRLLQGWTITNGLGIVWRDGRVDQVLLDEPDLSFPDPTDVAFTPDGRRALVTSATSDRVAVVDVPRLVALLKNASPHEREEVIPNHLGAPTEFVTAHIPTGASPRGVLVTRDGRTAFVANALDDSLTVIDMETMEASGEVDLGGPETITRARRGERLFHSANIAFHRQFSCHTCHPDGHIDGLTYDIEPDGIGLSPVDNRTLRGIFDTAPFKWEGTNPTLQRQCGPRLAVFFTRIQPFTPDELAALEHYIATIPRPLNRYRPVGAAYTPAQRRGKAIFERTRTNDGRAIPAGRLCVTCHPPPLYSDRRVHDIGTRLWLDRDVKFDTPQLTNVYGTAPYLHNGIAPTLEEIWTRYNPYDEHGVTNDMTKDQLNDLIEFLNTL